MATGDGEALCFEERESLKTFILCIELSAFIYFAGVAGVAKVVPLRLTSVFNFLTA